MLNVILAALPVLGSLIPKGKTADIVAAGTKVAQEVFGTTDEATVIAKMEADPLLAEHFKARLEAETASLRLRIEDTQDARASNNRLAEMGHAGYWSGPVIDTVVVFGFFGTLFMLLARPVQLSPEMLTLLTTMVGFLGNNFAQIVNYHRGSSAGSAAKDLAIKQIAAAK